MEFLGFSLNGSANLAQNETDPQQYYLRVIINERRAMNEKRSLDPNPLAQRTKDIRDLIMKKYCNLKEQAF